MSEQKFNSGYSPIPKADTVPEGRSMTEQLHMKACDVNNIVKRFERTGVMEHVQGRAPQYTDVSEVPDYHAALEVVKAVEEMFSSMPAVLRDKFDNDAGVYLEWINDPANRAEAVEMQLLPGVEQPETGPEGGAGGASGSSEKTGPETPESPPAAEGKAP